MISREREKREMNYFLIHFENEDDDDDDEEEEFRVCSNSFIV